MISSITNRTTKSLQNNVVTANKHTFWKTNFNVPVKNLFVDTSNWIRYYGCFNYGDTGTVWNLTGFSPGFEIVVYNAIWDWENNEGATRTINVYLYSKWVDTDNSTTLLQGANGYNLVVNLSDGYWTEYIWCVHIGVAGWEVWKDYGTYGAYYVKANATGNYPISEVSTGIYFASPPDTTQLASGKQGYIWVEGNNLCFVNANRWKHTMIGTQVSTTPGVSKAGHIWIDTSNELHWVGENGYDYKAAWKVKQFASYFSNSSTSEVNAGTDKKGFTWVDNQFGWTHLSYIGNDGYKYLTGAGDNPYA